MSDISWEGDPDAALREYKKGDNVEAVILSIDAEKERISLGIKQSEEDPFNNYLAENKKGAIVKGKVTAVDAKGATVELADSVEGYIRVADISRDRIEDASTELSVDQEIEAKYVGVDRKNRVISLSIRAKDEAEEKSAVESVNNNEESFSSNAMAEAFKNANRD
jgi:small subunit ribosomal protein S1